MARILNKIVLYVHEFGFRTREFHGISDDKQEEDMHGMTEKIFAFMRICRKQAVCMESSGIAVYLM
jgi:hypothetical protein